MTPEGRKLLHRIAARVRSMPDDCSLDRDPDGERLHAWWAAEVLPLWLLYLEAEGLR